MADTKTNMISDQEIVGKVNTEQDEAVHVAGLSEEEKKLEKKLVRKIDFIIMPMILLVYLLNWIDRCVQHQVGGSRLRVQKQLRFRSSRRTRR